MNNNFERFNHSGLPPEAEEFIGEELAAFRQTVSSLKAVEAAAGRTSHLEAVDPRQLTEQDQEMEQALNRLISQEDVNESTVNEFLDRLRNYTYEVNMSEAGLDDKSRSFWAAYLNNKAFALYEKLK